MSKGPHDDEPPYPEWPAPDPTKRKERDELGRIKKGSSGNYNGRPPKPVRALTSRGFARDIIAEAERMVDIGGESLSMMQLMVRQVAHDALKGDHRARQIFFDLHHLAVEAVTQLNPEESNRLELLEKDIKDVGPNPGNALLKMLYDARKKAKKL